MSDERLREAIRADLAASPFLGEGPRKGWARLRILRGIRVSRRRVPRLMREHLRFWGITPNFAFVAEPETNGVAERFHRTLKEQAIYARIFRNLEEVREAIDAFVKRYHAHWRLEKLGFQTPLEARQAALHPEAA